MVGVAAVDCFSVADALSLSLFLDECFAVMLLGRLSAAGVASVSPPRQVPAAVSVMAPHPRMLCRVDGRRLGRMLCRRAAVLVDALPPWSLF